MENDKSLNQPDDELTDNDNRNRTEQFNELSELSLEARMAVADQIGIPVRNAGEASALGTMSSEDEANELNNMVEEDENDEDRNR